MLIFKGKIFNTVKQIKKTGLTCSGWAATYEFHSCFLVAAANAAVACCATPTAAQTIEFHNNMANKSDLHNAFKNLEFISNKTCVSYFLT